MKNAFANYERKNRRRGKGGTGCSTDGSIYLDSRGLNIQRARTAAARWMPEGHCLLLFPHCSTAPAINAATNINETSIQRWTGMLTRTHTPYSDKVWLVPSPPNADREPVLQGFLRTTNSVLELEHCTPHGKHSLDRTRQITVGSQGPHHTASLIETTPKNTIVCTVWYGVHPETLQMLLASRAIGYTCPLLLPQQNARWCFMHPSLLFSRIGRSPCYHKWPTRLLTRPRSWIHPSVLPWTAKRV